MPGSSDLSRTTTRNEPASRDDEGVRFAVMIRADAATASLTSTRTPTARPPKRPDSAPWDSTPASPKGADRCPAKWPDGIGGVAGELQRYDGGRPRVHRDGKRISRPGHTRRLRQRPGDRMAVRQDHCGPGVPDATTGADPPVPFNGRGGLPFAEPGRAVGSIRPKRGGRPAGESTSTG